MSTTVKMKQTTKLQSLSSILELIRQFSIVVEVNSQEAFCTQDSRLLLLTQVSIHKEKKRCYFIRYLARKTALHVRAGSDLKNIYPIAD